MPGRTLWLLLPAALAGCGDVSPTDRGVAPLARPKAGSRFDAARAGTIRGVVTWADAPPAVPAFRSIARPMHENQPPDLLDWPNPNAPLPAAAPRAVRGAVVFLRGIVPEDGKPWPESSVRIVAGQARLVVVEGGKGSRTGFLRAGDEVEVNSRGDEYHHVQARGAAFFSLPLPDAGATARRRLDAPGVVELRSGAGYFWHRAWLFVDHHPYYTHTDERGHFTFEGVPPGDYEVVAWHPDWRVARRERHMELRRVTQVLYGPALERARAVRLAARERREVDLTLGP